MFFRPKTFRRTVCFILEIVHFHLKWGVLALDLTLPLDITLNFSSNFRDFHDFRDFDTIIFLQINFCMKNVAYLPKCP